MTWGLVAVAGSTLVGAYGANKAAKAQLQGAREGAAAEREMFERQVELQQPMIDVRNNMLPELVEASRYTPFGMEQFQADPGYGFRLKEGLRALENSAAARGGLLSGNTMRGITRYGQGLASDEYTNAFNRYQAERQARLGPLQSLVGLGQTSANTIGSAAGQLGSNLSNLAVGAGNARASGYAGMANALSSGIGQGLNYYQGNQAARQQQQNFDTYMNYLKG
jgi:hypothetical protein